MTRGANIEYNLMKSPYIVTRGRLTFVFSSKNHAEKFEQKEDAECKTMEKSLSKRFNLHFACNDLASVKLYQKIELRGFLIICNNDAEKIYCDSTEKIGFVGRIMRRKE